MKKQKLKYQYWKIYFLFFTIIFSSAQAQVYINGVDIHSLPTSIIYVNADSLIIENNGFLRQEGLLVIDKDLVVNNGKLNIEGTIDVENDILNNDSIIGFGANSIFLLNRNWINNSTFISGQNLTVLDGSTQIITGSTITNFYNLQALGTVADIKRLVGINSTVASFLDLTDVEFATDENDLSILNPATNAIQRNDGFVSSLGVGKLERLTNTSSSYLFPTGSSLGVFRYRPIEIIPNNNNLETFGVRLANNNASNNGFDVLILDDSLCAVNPNFYHKIYGNSSADISMFYIPSEDGEWNTMAQWETNSEWNKLSDEQLSNSGQFSQVTITDVSNFDSNNFALGLGKPDVFLDNEIEIEEGESITLTPFYNGPSPQSVVWFPLENIDCPNCLDTEITPIETGVYNLEISVTQNCIIRDSILIIVNPAGLFLPTAFSPNSDGFNDFFRPMNTNLEAYNISIFNRWGEMVFSSDNPTLGWDGTYKGTNSELGVYTYSAEYRFKNQTETKYQSNNLTLLR